MPLTAKDKGVPNPKLGYCASSLSYDLTFVYRAEILSQSSGQRSSRHRSHSLGNFKAAGELNLQGFSWKGETFLGVAFNAARASRQEIKG